MKKMGQYILNLTSKASTTAIKRKVSPSTNTTEWCMKSKLFVTDSYNQLYDIFIITSSWIIRSVYSF